MTKKSGAARKKKAAQAAAASASEDVKLNENVDEQALSSDSEMAVDTSSEPDPMSVDLEAPEDPEAGLTAQEKASKRKEDGTEAYKAKDYQAALEHYTSAIEHDSEFVPAIFNRAAAYMALKKYRLALEDCHTTLSLQGEPAQAKTLARLGKVQLALGQLEQAKSTLSSARNACTSSGDAVTLKSIQADMAKLDRITNHLASVQRERERKSYSMMLYALEQAIKEVDETPFDWRVLKLEGLIGKRAYDEAAMNATDMVRSNPSNPDGLYWRGQVFNKTGNFDQAKIHFTQSLRNDPDFPPAKTALKRVKQFEAHREAGKQAFSSKNWQEAVDRYSEALAEFAEDGNEHITVLFRSNRAMAYAAMKDWANVLEDSNQVLKLQPNHFKALRSQARAHLGMEEFEASVRSFKAAFEVADEKDKRSIKIEIESAERALKISKQKDYYKELGLNRHSNPTEDEIKKAYRRESLKHHPDKGGTEEKFKVIGEAYSILSDPVKRRRVDAGEDPEGGGGMGGMSEDMFGGHPFGGGYGGYGGGGYSSGHGGHYGGGGVNLEDLFGSRGGFSFG